MMSSRVIIKKDHESSECDVGKNGANLAPVEEVKHSEDSDDEFYDVERSDLSQDVRSGDSSNADSLGVHASQDATPEHCGPWKEELECLVRGGLPMALRGELWQAFVGVAKRRVDGYYNNLLNPKSDTVNSKVVDTSHMNNTDDESEKRHIDTPEKWKGQIEKDLPRTFPGHPALDEDGRNALRRLLTAYARHNSSVGYCQAMNFFAGLLLLLMPEENAFWTLVGIIDDYFDGYYSEEMIESQVDQLVLEELVRERFPKLVNHLDYLGVQVAWVTGSWFLSMFVNVLPWESVLRVWDVLLFDGNRTMLFRTALALMELYGPALVTTRDAGDAVTLLQSLAGSTFDSSQLVLTACMGYQAVNEIRLGDLRKKHGPAVLAAMEEGSTGLRAWRDSHGLASKLYNFRRDPGLLTSEAKSTEELNNMHSNGDLHLAESNSNTIEEFLNSLSIDAELDSLSLLKEQVTWLKVELCRLLEEKRSAILRAEELETALMEMVRQDNRRLLSAKVEQLEQEVSELQQTLKDKQEQEQVMLQVLMRIEREQKVTEDARLCAEQGVAAQKYATHVLQEKYEETLYSLAQMEKRAIMAETMLEATLQYQSSQMKAQSPRTPTFDHSPARTSQETSQDFPTRKIGLLSRPFGLGWRDKNKGKPNAEGFTEGKPINGNGRSLSTSPDNDMNGGKDMNKDVNGDKDRNGNQEPEMVAVE
ncbi:TBC1 domain family member 8B-like isoform X1 [Iris pallida]|uniref:TBC1 domain family member 8B-like isoform X1 n=1 Tax=Iris pallida TaxID=29817 RepID=A0AAX6F7X7_IRIPA|nr:TBC1 domain family member 8B-like isoform X1 [Iris pallida]